jgi:RND superfamily putative drug exporter
VQNLTNDVAANEHVEQAINYYQTGQPSLISRDKTATIILVTLEGEFVDQEKHAAELVEIARNASNATFEVKATGPAAIAHNFSEVSEQDLQRGEIYGLPITLVILAIVFGAIVAALLPLALSVIAIVAAVGATAVAGSVGDPVSFFVVNMITMMGLAVGVDYSLFVVSRFREERGKGVDKAEAIVRSSGTAGKAVVFSGLTVVLALLGLFLIPMNIFQGLAIGAIFVVIFAVLAATTLLPALLAILGDRINAGKIGPRRDLADDGSGGFWHHLTTRIMARPVASLLLATGLLLLASVPALELRIGASGIGAMPERLEARQAYELLRDKFSLGFLSPAFVVVEGDLTSPDVQEGLQRFQARLGGNPLLGPATVMSNENSSVALIQFQINAENTSEAALQAVKDLRGEIIPDTFGAVGATALVGGEASGNLDFINISKDHVLPVFAFVLGLSFLLLMVVFRSLIVPLKAILMNLLSVAASYGLLTLVFQKGVGNELFGFQQVERIEAWLPLFLFCVLFGLSMDYHVFLLSRIREQFLKVRDNTRAVVFGVRSTASIITGAALIMVAVFASFAAGDLVMFQQMGFGLATAILIDATVVRSFLVPASMRLLGERNWYLPRFLHWLPNVSVEGKSKH